MTPALRRRGWRTSLRGPFILFLLSAIVAAFAAAPAPTRDFDIPAGDAAKTLEQFAAQSGTQLVYPTDRVRGVRTNAVRGALPPVEALERMVAGTSLVVVRDQKSGALVVRREAAPEKNGERPLQPPLEAGAKPAAQPRPDDEPLLLNPFEVTTSKDTSYGALNSNSITRFNTELNKVPFSADIYTATFMQDVDQTTIDALLLEYGGAQMSFANPAGQVNLNQPGDRNTTSGFTFRGLSSGPIRVNGFVTEGSNFVNTTNFNIERVEVIHGPQGLLYGPGGAGGTIVATTLQAKFNNQSGKISERIDQFGSKRTVVQANTGADWLAASVAVLDEQTRYRRLFFGGNGSGYYGQLAFHLPLRTTLRIDATYTFQNLINALGTTGVSFGGVANDPRNGYQLANLLFTGQAGATNPATGAPFSKFGPIDNGNLSWQNVYSFGGAVNWEMARNTNLDAIVDTVWTKWLSTNIGFNYSRLNDLFGGGTGANLSAPLLNGNPYNAWSMNYTPTESMNNRRHKNFRASALVTNELFRGRAKSQTSFGYDFQRQGTGGTTYNYYLSDSAGNLILTPGGNNLGRTPVPQQWWVVDGGPVFKSPVFYGRGPSIFQSPQNKQYYVKMLANPSDPKFITPFNPLGLYSLATDASGKLLYPGVTGQNLSEYQKEVTSTGFYAANFTSWWDDLFTTMMGYRYTKSANHIPSGANATVVAGAIDTSEFHAPSYNLGIDGRITSWLRWFYGYSANYNIANGQTDFYGEPVDQSYGRGQELGLKFTPLDSRISGSLQVYENRNTGFAFNAGAPVLASINPTNALNGPSNGPAGASTFVPEDYISRGVELALNANPTPNWRIHFSANYSNGYVHSDATYGILYNDQFYTDNRGNVTYANGSPFLVPVTPGASITGLSTTVNPNTNILVGVPTTQLTTAMIGNPGSPYYAWQGTTVTANGQIAPTSNVYKVLKNFNVPGAGTALTNNPGQPISAIQYAWPDPGKTGGNVVVTQSGQKTVAYPVYQFNLVNTYQVGSGPLKGLGALLSLTAQWQWRNFYYNTPASPAPVLWKQASLGCQINLNPFYEHKFKRFTWRTQVNITNLTNHYRVELTPNNGLGFTSPSNLGIRWDNQPRVYAWSNTITF
jgi:outer membrane receptor protein involved in Fe transport